MTELEDAGTDVGDPAAVRARLAADGYVFARGLLDPAEVGAIGRRGMATLQTAGWTAPGADPVTAPACLPVRAVAMRDAFGDPAYHRLALDPGLHRLAFESPLADLMHRLLGPMALCYPLKIPRVVYPAALVPRHPGAVAHHDYRAVQDLFTCWVPLVDTPQALGGLALRPGSQRTATVAHRVLDRLPPGWATADYRPGDVLLFHCLTAHGALPNRTDRLRLSAELRWQTADRPAPRRAVLGPAGVEIGARVLAGRPWWRPVPPGLALFDDDRPPPGPPAPSRFVAFGT